jgi:hypothetical protein
MIADADAVMGKTNLLRAARLARLCKPTFAMRAQFPSLRRARIQTSRVSHQWRRTHKFLVALSACGTRFIHLWRADRLLHFRRE